MAGEQLGVGIDLSLVIPAYNEESRLPSGVAAALAHLRARGLPFEVVLSDDGSTDGTLDWMEAQAAAEPEVRVVSHRPNRGKGRAIADGVAASTGRLVLVSDADFSTPIDQLPRLELALTAGAGVAIGSRAKKGAREIDQPLHRRLMGKVFNLIVQAILLPGLWDTQCGFKLLEGDLARRLCAELRIDGFAYDVELLWRARGAGAAIAEIPVRWLNSDSTRVAPMRDSLRMLRDVVALRVRG